MEWESAAAEGGHPAAADDQGLSFKRSAMAWKIAD